jgi:hypothetical protein
MNIDMWRDLLDGNREMECVYDTLRYLLLYATWLRSFDL